MADYVTNHIYINGSKQAIVDFLNRGLKGAKAKERLSANMSGEEMVALMNGLKQPLSMGSFFPRPKTFDTYDTTNRIKAFNEWYLDGCVPFFVDKTDSSKQRLQEIIDYLKAHPEEFQPNGNGMFNWIAKGTAIERLHPGTNAAYIKYTKGYYQARYYQKKKYGVVGWYDWNKENYGCKWDMAIEDWWCEKDKDDMLCLYVGIQTPWSPVYKFFERINAFDGITVYAHASGDMNCPFFFWYNGRIDKGDAIKPKDDEKYKQREKELDAIKEQKMAEAGNLHVAVIKELIDVGYEPSEFEWIRVEGDEALMGITSETIFKLGEIVSVDVVPAVGKVVPQGEVIGSVKTVNTVYDLYMPATGEVLAFNAELRDHPELANKDPYDAGWMIRIRLSNPSEIDKLADAERVRWSVEEEWQDAMMDLDWEILDEKEEQFIKEIYADMGLEYPPKPHSRPESKEQDCAPEEEWKPYVHDPDLPF